MNLRRYSTGGDIMTTFAELQTQIRDYTEATTDVLTDVS